MNVLNTLLGKALAVFPKRYLFRLGIILSSLAINSWAIASFVPAHQANSDQTKLSVSDLSLSFATPRPEKAVDKPLKKSVKKTLTPTQKKLAKRDPAPQKKPELTSTLLAEAPLEKLVSLEQSQQQKLEPVSQPEVIHTELAGQEKNAIEEPSSLSLAANATPTNPLISNPSFAAPPKQPRYPSLARKRGQEGIVWLEVWLNDTGEQTKLEVSESSGVRDLDKAALKAVKHWQFQPHRHEGLAIASRVKIPVEFALN